MRGDHCIYFVKVQHLMHVVQWLYNISSFYIFIFFKHVMKIVFLELRSIRNNRQPHAKIGKKSVYILSSSNFTCEIILSMLLHYCGSGTMGTVEKQLMYILSLNMYKKYNNIVTIHLTSDIVNSL